MSGGSAKTRSVDSPAPRWEQGSLFAGALDPGLNAANQSRYRAAGTSDAHSLLALTTVPKPPGERHLRAARRLSREIRGQRGSRRARTATGLAICSHLLALLDADTNIDSDRDSPRGTLSKV